MRIAKVYSHLNGMEFLDIHRPSALKEIRSVVESVDVRPKFTKTPPASPSNKLWQLNTLTGAEIGVGLKECGWSTRQEPEDGSTTTVWDLVKSRVAVAIHTGNRRMDSYGLYAQHLALYIGDVIDVGIEIVPMKSIQAEMASGPGYEGELSNLIREGRGVPGVRWSR